VFRLEAITKSYTRRGHEVVAFRAASVSIGKGEYVAIVGPSGSGKTSLLSMLGGMLSPNLGRVLFCETSLYDLSVEDRTRLRRQNIGFVFQTFNLVPYLSAIENVQLPLYLAGLSPDAQREQALKLLDRVGLGDRVDHKPCELSVGQQQRVALARTLSNNPPVILADEPTGNLDPDSRAQVLDFFDELHAEGHTIVMVTHDVAAADRAERRLSLRAGEISPSTTAQAVRAAA
jgi:putative ABC transport system ATP-binding protein